MYWNALKSIHGARGGAVAVPAPHPKFSVSDLKRIAARGPRFNDVVLEHAERIHEPGAADCFCCMCFVDAQLN